MQKIYSKVNKDILLLTLIRKDNIIYEFKNGPYYGVEADKTFII